MDLASLRKVFRWERLPPPPPPGSGAARRPRGLLAVLFASEILPEDPVPAPRPARAGGAKLLAPEPLPEDPPGPPRRGRTHWLRWLFAAEKLDP